MKKSELRKLIREVIKEQKSGRPETSPAKTSPVKTSPVKNQSMLKIGKMIDSQGDSEVKGIWVDFVNWLAGKTTPLIFGDDE
tara:strand:+ start:1077 stop:1322 length:246 start_codon:yes stop_codon:yes gene_type:complete